MNKKWGIKRFLMIALSTILLVALTACGGETAGDTPKLEESKEKLEAGTYTGVFIVTEIPMIKYIEQAVEDPSSLPELDGEEAEMCEGIDLSDPEIKAQIDDAMAKAKSTIGVEVPLTVVITAGSGDTFTSTVRVDFAAAFPDYECEEAEDEPYTVTHSEGKVTLTNISDPDEEGVSMVTKFEGAILKGGKLEGNFVVTNPSDEYVEYTGSDVMMNGTWKVSK